MQITKETPLDEVRKIGEKCTKCGSCCRFGSGFMLESEISRITAFLKTPREKFIANFLEETEIFNTKLFKFKSKRDKGRAYGPCMFLENQLCKIQEVKPLHCVLGNCSDHGDDLHVWFITNYCLNIYDPESIRQYCSYVETGGRVIPGAEIEKLFPDKKKLAEIRSYERLK